MVAVCNNTKNDVLNCVKAIGSGSCEVIVQTTEKRYNSLNVNQSEVPGFAKRHKAGHVVDMDSKTLHTLKCKKVGKRSVKARIINNNATGLTLCGCIKNKKK